MAEAAAGLGPASETEGPGEGLPSSGSFTFSAGNVLPEDRQHLPAPDEHMPAPAAAADGSAEAAQLQLQLSASLRPAEPHAETASQDSAPLEPTYATTAPLSLALVAPPIVTVCCTSGHWQGC